MFIRREDSTVYVINHAYAQGGERIEVFDILSDHNGHIYSLDYKYSITGDFFNENAMGVLNNLVVVDTNKLYVTRYSGVHGLDGKPVEKLTTM